MSTIETTQINEAINEPCCGTDCCGDSNIPENTSGFSNNEEMKSIVKEQYGRIADQSKTQNETSCCGTSCCDTVDYAVFAEDYTKLKGYNPDADLGLGCGMPTEFARIKEGNTVIDLGSGAGTGHSRQPGEEAAVAGHFSEPQSISAGR